MPYDYLHKEESIQFTVLLLLPPCALFPKAYNTGQAAGGDNHHLIADPSILIEPGPFIIESEFPFCLAEGIMDWTPKEQDRRKDHRDSILKRGHTNEDRPWPMGKSQGQPEKRMLASELLK